MAPHRHNEPVDEPFPGCRRLNRPHIRCGGAHTVCGTPRLSDIGSTVGVVETITKRELNQHTAAVLDRVTDIDDVVVTEYGKPRWRVSTVHDHDTVLDRLEHERRYTPPASTPTPWPDHPGGPAYTSDQVDALLDEVRGDH